MLIVLKKTTKHFPVGTISKGKAPLPSGYKSVFFFFGLHLAGGKGSTPPVHLRSTPRPRLYSRVSMQLVVSHTLSKIAAALVKQGPLDAEKPSALTNVKDMCLKETPQEGSFRPKLKCRVGN